MMQVIRDFLYETGKSAGIDVFLKTIGPWGVLILTVFLGVIALMIACAIIKQSAMVETTWLKVTLIITLLAITVFAFYIYIDGTIIIIDKLGGLQMP